MVDPRIGTTEQPSAVPQKSDAELSGEMSSPRVIAPVVENMEKPLRQSQAPEIPSGPDPDTIALINSRSQSSKTSSHKEDEGRHSLILGLAITGGLLIIGFAAAVFLTKFGAKASQAEEIQNDEYDDNRLIIG